VNKAAYSSQHDIAEAWADGALPTHCTTSNGIRLYSSDNFKGIQHPDGSGELQHYSHIQAIRTKSGLIIGDSSCYGRGLAYCTYPNDTEERINLTALKKQMNSSETIYDITEIDGSEVTFNTDRVYDLEKEEWIQDSDEPDNPVLGL
jgi:hypothetical protein